MNEKKRSRNRPCPNCERRNKLTLQEETHGHMCPECTELANVKKLTRFIDFSPKETDYE